MNCLVCDTELKRVERQGVEIDTCPRCRGVWLDRGELDKIIERSTSTSFSAEREDVPTERQNSGRRRRGSFLEDLFG
ncbi:MAG: zf-TFIIB domain-containing protein [Dehalococcoidia bacterium]|nr:hypothetical protein [Chloroflexota bacterium]MBT9163026.1 hypothetical protein [Chloroflexota bacterium]